MPIVRINIHKWDIDKKRKLVADLTRVFENFGVPKELVLIQITEDEPENVGVGGALLVDLGPPPPRLG